MTASVCVVGSFMYDVVATAARRPEPGETVIGSSLATYVGGKGFNQAVASARAGAPTAMIGRVGDDSFGSEFHQALDTEGIDATHVLTDLDQGTGVGLPVVDGNGQNSIIVVPRANLAVSAADVDASAQVIEAASVLLLQLELKLEPILAAARIAHQAGLTVILNPAPYIRLPAELRDLVDIVVPNEGELRALAAETQGADGDTSILALARAVATEWKCAVVVTRGEQGVVVVPDTGHHETVGAYPVDAVDTIGAGDTFCGNLGARLAHGTTLAAAVSFANAAAALSVTRNGGAPAAPYAAETQQLLDKAGDSLAGVP